MIKVITFCIGVDVLGFPQFHKHILKYVETSSIPVKYSTEDKIKGITSRQVNEKHPYLYNRKMMQK